VSQPRQTAPSALKRYLPRTLLGRAILIVVTPVVLVQAIAAFIFYDRHWGAVTARLVDAVAGEVTLLVQQLERLPPDARGAVIAHHERLLGMRVSFEVTPDAQPWETDTGLAVGARLTETLARPVAVVLLEADEHVAFRMDSPLGPLSVSVPRRRLFTSTGQIFFLWLAGSSLLLTSIALVFLRNQIRPIRQLAIAAERFGKGQDMARFKPAGASEVRQAARAFIAMRDRIRRQIAQRTEMLAGVSHDLRTPLTRIRLELELLGAAAPQGASDNAEGLATIRKDLAEMEMMIDGYLAFAEGQAEEGRAEVDLVALLRDLVTDAPLDLPPAAEVLGQPQALRRCLVNLLENARRYAGRFTVTLNPDARRAVIDIDDDGPGIPPDQREAVFRPFHRLEESRNPATGGVGLGLAIARDIARFHGGDITLHDAPQGGLRVRLVLPK